MLPNWLTGSQQGQQDDDSKDRHVVLGTPLKAPLMEDQEEIVCKADKIHLDEVNIQRERFVNEKNSDEGTTQSTAPEVK